MRTAAEYQQQWDDAECVEQMNVVFGRLVRSYSAMEDRMAMIKETLKSIRPLLKRP